MMPSLVARSVANYQIASWRRLLPKIEQFESEFVKFDDARLRKESLSLRYRARSGEPLTKLLCEAFALVQAAGARSLGMRHYPVQLLGGIALHHRSIVEMQTGEGKTLTATLPMYLAAIAGHGAHLATANDYLAKRDAEWMRPLYAALGMSIGIIEADTPQPERRKAYRCDVTYGTAKEFGFDFLRDRLLKRHTGDGRKNLLAQMLGQSQAGADEIVQRDLHFALIDEADSILIDEARTPLIISSIPGESPEVRNTLYRWASESGPLFVEETEYEFDHERREAVLTPAGRRKVRELPKPTLLREIGLIELYEHIERAIKVDREFVRDRQFIIRDGEIVIVDEFTGRLAEGRKWRAGIHQAVEAREGVEITAETGEAAKITVQDLFRRYERLAGMTGTIANSGAELRKIYSLNVVVVPTNRPPQRIQLPDVVVGVSKLKWQKIVEEVKEISATGRPVLIGTRSIDKSKIISDLLAAEQIEHQVLNATEVSTAQDRMEAEAKIVAQAGEIGRVTVATNMAGRGTDIKLGEGVEELGGLHVICTELHESARIDRQLIGRCGRQGDRGSYRQYLSLDDEILKAGYGPKAARRLAEIGQQASAALPGYARRFRAAQARVERDHFRGRKMMMHYERERHKMQMQMGQDPYLDSPSS
ncbi:preprotein translocase subunit SecA [Lignipirellula cremea]|uniref:Protein translocase subunit SecA n=1 Tax=Lignipirellula cremea TaxID=2528010 RepID=A0A518DT75_9BACT|nr:helicase-related protein [Lignipirellula cremea]QDU95041.1 preprotein translocase subunit SecA [Lignipirellula cremea]